MVKKLIITIIVLLALTSCAIDTTQESEQQQQRLVIHAICFKRVLHIIAEVPGKGIGFTQAITGDGQLIVCDE